MRETYSTILQTSKDFCIDDNTSSTTNLSSTESFLISQINNTISFLHEMLPNYKVIPLPRTMTTTADQIYYSYPPNMLKVHSITMTVGDIDYPLRAINAQEIWDQFQQVDVAASEVPQYYFPRQHDFGIYPTPDDAYTVTLVATYLPQRITATDYITGSVDLTQNSATVTGNGTTFTSDMVGRWLCLTDASNRAIGTWYRINAFTNTTTLTLDSVFEESTVSANTYVIGQSPEIPPELHEYIPYRVASSYYSTIRKDPQQAQALLNFFYTGDFNNPNRGKGIQGGVIGIMNRYKQTGRSNSQVNYMNKSRFDLWHPLKEAWGTTLS